MSHLADESGQVLALTVLYLGVLVGMAALVVDAGAWYQADRRLQATADAAALAGAQALPNDPAGAVAVALEYARLNGGGVAVSDVTVSSALEPADTIAVEARGKAPGVFARLFGIDSVAVGSSAAARTAPLGAARRAAPFAVAEQHPLLRCVPEPCFDQTTNLPLGNLKDPESSSAAGSFGIVNYDGANGPVGLPTLADWVRHGYPGTLAPGAYFAGTGAKFNAVEVREALAERVGTEMLLPVYRTITGSGATAKFEIVGWVGFVLESFSGSGSTGNLRGRFTSLTWDGDPGAATQPQFGARTLVLVQ